MYKIVGTLVAVSLSTAGRIAMMQYLKPSAVPPIQFAMPTGTPLPGTAGMPPMQPITLPFAIPGQPGLSFPSPSTILGSGPAPAPARTAARREAARSGARTPYSPAKSFRGTARPAPVQAARVAEAVRKAQPAPGR
ncbi:MAG TPA: hypothetical protein VGH33_13535 [Isosphaeraceae bacterium]|jgi:hypothetical protein